MPRSLITSSTALGLAAAIAAAGLIAGGAPAAQAEVAVPRLTIAALTAGPFAGSTDRLAARDELAPPVSSIRRAKARTKPWAYPVREGTPISGTFGEVGTYWPGGHAGIDFDGVEGDPIFAVIGGRVTYATFNSGGYGNLVMIRRGDGTVVRYAHLSRIEVDKGDRIRAGERIGRMGATGQVTGAHLHLEVRVNNGQTPTNPASLWAGKRPGIPADPPAWSCAKYGGCA